MLHTLRRPWARAALLSGMGGGVAYAAWYSSQRTDVARKREAPGSPKSVMAPVAQEQPGTFSAAQVRSNAGKDQPVWVTYSGGVYDITDFIEMHPGGDHILEAAGGPLEPYFELYAQHKDDFVLELLEEYRIGDLNAADAKKIEAKAKDPYALEPIRVDALEVRSQKPYNAEPPPDTLVLSHHTPNELFYVRNHLPVPVVDADAYRLRVLDVEGKELASLSLDEIRALPRHTVSATVQCAGNRRDEMSEKRAVRGGSWGSCAIGNAEWAGARLADVLPRDALDRAEHVVFDGLDIDPGSGASYGASVPVDVLQRNADGVLLAYEMNGAPLPIDHGYPVRAVVPGIVGARNVKWLGEVRLSREESESHWQQRDYKSFSPAVDWDNVKWESAPAIQELPVVSAICKMERKVDTVRVEGYAWSGGGRGIIRVDVSSDGGKKWTTATLRDKKESWNRVYDWTLWSVDVPVKAGEEVEVVCKATDSAYNTQPESVDPIWNLRGVLNNAWHRMKLENEEIAKE